MCTVDERLNPCPFCAGGETTLHPNLFWTGQRNEVLSVEIKHWCWPQGLPRVYLSVTGKDEEQAIAAWNTRAA